MFFYYYSDLHSNALSGSLPDQWGFLLSLASLYATSFLNQIIFATDVVPLFAVIYNPTASRECFPTNGAI